MLYEQILLALGKALKDDTYRASLLANPTATLKADGVNIGNAVVTIEWVDITNALNIHVANGGADWNGAILLQIEK